MSDKYKITDKDRPCFLTLTIVAWIEVAVFVETQF